jgi:hypothetical protein
MLEVEVFEGASSVGVAPVFEGVAVRANTEKAVASAEVGFGFVLGIIESEADAEAFE